MFVDSGISLEIMHLPLASSRWGGGAFYMWGNWGLCGNFATNLNHCCGGNAET